MAIDLEATGMNPESDRIIEIAAVKFTPERILDRWQTLVRPGLPIPFAVSELTGITNADVRGAPPFAAIAPTLRAFVSTSPIVGQSVELDIAMLRAAGLPLRNPLIDTFELGALLLPQLPAYGLAGLAEAMGRQIPTGLRHRAMYDAELAAGVFTDLWERVLDFEAETLGEVVQLTAGSGWGLHPFFVEAQRAKTRSAFGASLGSALRAKLAPSGDGPAGELGYLIQRPRPQPLEPTGAADPLDVDRLATALEPDSPFVRLFPDYEHRPPQVAMLRAVAAAFNEAGQLLVEAGTGTGKSMAYLLPAAVAAARRGETVIVSTKTIQLQDQLFHKDIPAVRAALGALADAAEGEVRLPRSFRAAVLKGRTNYLCLRRWAALRRSGAVPKEEVRTVVKILLWLQATETGDRAELRLLPGEEITWARVMATEDTCTPALCSYHRAGQCFLNRARREAEAAHIVIVNHALLLSDMVANSQVLPAYKHLIIDEAHRLEDEATAQLSYSVDRRRVLEELDTLARQAGGRTEGLVPDVLAHLRVAKVPQASRQAAEKAAVTLLDAVAPARQAAVALFACLEAALAERGDAGDGPDLRLRLTPAVRHARGWAAVEEAGEELGGWLARVGLGLSELSGILERCEPAAIVDYERVVGEVASAVRANGELRLRLNSIIANPDAEMIYWCEVARQTQAVSMHAAPLHVGERLESGLYAERLTLVLTSATLTTDGSFGYLRERLSLSEARAVQIESPFDYEAAALLYLAADMPEPGQPGYQRRLEQGLVALCEATGGRALVLFTSHSALRATYAAVKPALEARGILALGQRLDGSPRQLLERLKASKRAVIFGTATFWEGIDVVGDSLSILVITKLPFKVPTDPVFAARSERFANPFGEYAVPQTVLTFKQGFGRLIRSRTDRGVVAVLDRRLLTKSYGRTFLASLPACTERRGTLAELPRAAREWIDRTPEEVASGLEALAE